MPGQEKIFAYNEESTKNRKKYGWLIKFPAVLATLDSYSFKSSPDFIKLTCASPVQKRQEFKLINILSIHPNNDKKDLFFNLKKWGISFRIIFSNPLKNSDSLKYKTIATFPIKAVKKATQSIVMTAGKGQC